MDIFIYSSLCISKQSLIYSSKFCTFLIKFILSIVYLCNYECDFGSLICSNWLLMDDKQTTDWGIIMLKQVSFQSLGSCVLLCSRCGLIEEPITPAL